MAKDELKVVTLDELAEDVPIFRKRLAGDTLHFGKNDAVSVRVEALTYLQYSHAEAAIYDGDKGKVYWLLKFGVKDIIGLTDEDGSAVEFKTRKISVLGRIYDVVDDAILDGLHPLVADRCVAKIDELSLLSYRDAERLGFTKPSVGNVPSGAPEASAPVCNAGDTDGTGPQAA